MSKHIMGKTSQRKSVRQLQDRGFNVSSSPGKQCTAQFFKKRQVISGQWDGSIRVFWQG